MIRLSPNSPDALRVVTKTLSRPLLRRINRVAREALSKRLEIALAVERTHWKGATTMVLARWSVSEGRAFQDSYSRLLSGDLPQPGKGLKISGRLENFRGREWAIRLNFLNWIEMGKSTRSETRQALVVDPTGGILLEQTQELEKTRYKWDEVQFLRLLHRETTREGGRSSEFLWSYGRQQQFSHHSLDQLLRMALRVGIIPEYSLPATSFFPLTADLLLVTRFSSSGLSRVRQASPERKWQALVQALELAEPGRYQRKTFWRDWIDYPRVRERIDEDPVQTHLATRYPVGGRRESQRRQVVGAYRRSKRFLELLEDWSKGEAKVLQAFRLGMDIPVFVFFHLLCPAASRRSAALMTGEWEQSWGEAELLAQLTTDS